MFYVNLFLDSWAASVGVGISLTIFDSSTGNNSGSTGGVNTGNNGNTGNNNGNTGGITTGNNNGKDNGGDKPIKEDKPKVDKPIVTSGSTNSGSNSHPAPSSGSIDMTGNNTGTSVDSGSNYVIDKDLSPVNKGTSTKPSKIYTNQDKQIETKNKSDLEGTPKTLPEKKPQNQNVICEEDKKSVNVTEISKVENFIKFFLYGKKTNVKTSILCTTGTKDVLSGKLVSSSGTAKSKSGIVKDIPTLVVGVGQKEQYKVCKKSGIVSKISGIIINEAKKLSSSINTFAKIFPTRMIKSFALGNGFVEYFIKSIFSYFK